MVAFSLLDPVARVQFQVGPVHCTENFHSLILNLGVHIILSHAVFFLGGGEFSNPQKLHMKIISDFVINRILRITHHIFSVKDRHG